MKVLNCPLNGPRNIDEFVWGGEIKSMPDPAATSDEAWAAYLFLENNAAGVVREWWYHWPTAYWFVAERDTTTDTVIKTFPAADIFGHRAHPSAPNRSES
jgi:sarcosine oxidase subunit delta